MRTDNNWSKDEWLADKINEYRELDYAINLLKLSEYISEDLHRMLIARNKVDHKEALNEENRRNQIASQRRS